MARSKTERRTGKDTKKSARATTRKASAGTTRQARPATTRPRPVAHGLDERRARESRSKTLAKARSETLTATAKERAGARVVAAAEKRRETRARAATVAKTQVAAATKREVAPAAKTVVATGTGRPAVGDRKASATRAPVEAEETRAPLSARAVAPVAELKAAAKSSASEKEPNKTGMEPPVDASQEKAGSRKQSAEAAAAKKPSSRAPEKKAPAAPRRGKEAAAPGAGTARAGESSRAEKEAAPPVPPRKSRGKKAVEPPATAEEIDTADSTGLSDEEKIESAKYLPRDLPPRLFEEERFIFPETYGVNRLRLVARDPQWLFSHWDVDPQFVGELRRELGERAVAVSRLTLRITDPEAGGTKVIHVPEGSRSWYIRADSSPRAYRAEIGFTLPSGEFRKVAESSTVQTPWTGTSSEKARGRVRYDRVGVDAEAPLEAVLGGESAVIIDPGPWQPEGASEGEPSRRSPRAPGAQGQEQPDRGGASDTYRR